MHGMYGSYEPRHRRVGAALLQWLSLQGLQDGGGHHLRTHIQTLSWQSAGFTALTCITSSLRLTSAKLHGASATGVKLSMQSAAPLATEVSSLYCVMAAE